MAPKSGIDGHRTAKLATGTTGPIACETGSPKGPRVRFRMMLKVAGVMPCGKDEDVGMGYSTKIPLAVRPPILLPVLSANQSAPSGPQAIPFGSRSGVGNGNSVMAPAVAIPPMWPPENSVNQRAPSVPTAIPVGAPEAANPVQAPEVAIRPI